MNIQEGASEIYKRIEKALQEGTGLLVGRNGTIELECLFGYGNPSKLELHAGIWPLTYESIDLWIKRSKEAILATDVLVAGWYAPLAQQETLFLNTLGIQVPRIPLRSLEPYYLPPEKRWTSLLKDQTVAIISSFAQTALKQTIYRDEVWPLFTESILPSTTHWIPIVTGYCPALAQGVAEWPNNVQSWEDAVQHVVNEVSNTSARIAIVGCGGLGMVIAHELKKRGLIVIVLGGATQVLFGIKGGRWANHSVISTFWNDAWVYPSSTETPKGASRIENACYWQPNQKN